MKLGDQITGAFGLPYRRITEGVGRSLSSLAVIVLGDAEEPRSSNASRDKALDEHEPQQRRKVNHRANEVGRWMLQLGIFIAGFYLAYRYSMELHSSRSAPLWLPDAVLLTALLFTPKRRWWLFLLLPLPIRLFVDVPPHTPDWFLWVCYVNDSVKAVVGASVLRWLNKKTPALATVRELFQYFLVVVLATPILSAFGGASARVELGDNFWVAWQIWFLGNALANLMLTPMIIYWISDGFASLGTVNRWRWLEGIALYGILIAIGLIGLFANINGLTNSPILIYLPIPVVLFSAVRFGPKGVSTAFFLVTAFAIWSADRGYGPFAEQAAGINIIWLQLVFYVMAVPLLSVAVLVRESDRNAKTAHESHRRMQELAGRLIRLQDEERRRVARELHDSLGQSLALLRLHVETAIRSTNDRGRLFERLESIATLAALANEEMRDITHNLRPYELDRLGLSGAIRTVVERLDGSTEIEFAATIDDIDGLLSPNEEMSVYRIIREGLNNVIKHANATSATVMVRRSADEIRIIIEDNGTGFLRKADGDGLGLPGIAERVRLIGGNFDIDTSPGKGTRLRIKLGDIAGREEATNSGEFVVHPAGLKPATF